MNAKQIKDIAVKMTQDEYFAASEDRKVVTPENVGGLVDYPALFRAMQDDRELRPALSESQSTGRAMNDFLSMDPAEFLGKYVIADGPVNPKTGKPYGADTKAFIEWKATQSKIPVSSQAYNMFGKMAQAYNKHAFVKSLYGHERMRNVILQADISGVPCLCKVDGLYFADGSTFGIDVKTTSDLTTFARLAPGLYYPEQQALIRLVMEANGLESPQVRIVALEKGPLPRCGVFAISRQDEVEVRVKSILSGYAEGLRTGVFSTRFEAPVLI